MKVGTWRVPKRKTITLEHPANDQGRFTFYRLGTPEARAAELAEGPDLGLIEVRFLPGKPKPPLQEAGYRGDLTDRNLLIQGFLSAHRSCRD